MSAAESAAGQTCYLYNAFVDVLLQPWCNKGNPRRKHLGCCGKHLFVIALLFVLESCERRLALAKHLLLK